MTIEHKQSSKLVSILERAAEFHGHLGPFLTIGVKMGLIGLEKIGLQKGGSLIVEASLPLRTPFSCIIDGLQITTQCTIGNRKLSLRDSEKIQAEFRRKDSGQKIVIALNQSIFEKLKSQLLQDNLSDKEVRELAWKVAAIPENELFATT
jgi:formylmethanofuran dehydrogenase subunit E